MEHLHFCKHATIGKASTGNKRIVTFIQFHPIFKGTTPSASLLRIFQERGRTIRINAMQGEVAIIFRIINSSIISIFHDEFASCSHLLFSIVEINVNPFASICILILCFLSHLIHLSLDTQTSGNIHEEYLARAGIGKASTIYTDRSLSNLERLLIRIDADILLHPLNQETWIILESKLLLGKFLLKELLEWSNDHLVFYTWRQLVALGIEVIFQDIHLHISQILGTQCTEQADGTIQIILMIYQERKDNAMISA